MPKSIPVVFKRSLVAAAIISLSACSSLPQGSDFGLGSVGSGIAKAGKATASVGRKTWNKTTYLLGFTDSPDGDSQSQINEPLQVVGEDSVEALPIAQLPEIEGSDSNRPVLVQRATARSNAQRLQLGNTDALASNDTPAPANNAPANSDLIHEVTASETLWEIAKKTTGNANNWHTLADVNSLGQNATVFPGQKLVIPANLVKPGYGSPEAADVAAVVDTQDAPEAAVVADAKIIDDDAKSVATAPADKMKLKLPTPDTAKQPIAQAAADVSTELPNSLDAESFKVQAGETLWDFAKRTTGDATNWKAIATHNNFTEKQAVLVRPGQSILVPQKMVNDYLEAAEAAAAATTPLESVAAAPLIADPMLTDVEGTLSTPETLEAAASTIALPTAPKAPTAPTAPTAPAIQSVAAVPAAQGAAATAKEIAAALPSATGLQILQDQTAAPTAQAGSAASIADETQAITIVEATFKSDDSLDPVTAPNEPIRMVENENIPEEVMVSGTYYPKAVYNNADFSSSLLMRVSPGTTLQVSRAMGTWYEVETDKGLGYVHQRDIQ